jgi:hypothetical protein
MACVNWQDRIRITKSLHVSLSQDPQEPENVSSDHKDYIRKQKQKNLTLLEKAKILESLVSYAKQYSQNISHEFNDWSILLTAVTGAAATEFGGWTSASATEIGGWTSASVFGYMRKTNYARTEDIDFFKDTRLSVIDEISFAAYQSTLTKISEILKSFTECREHMQSVSWETVNLKPSVVTAFTNTKMVSIGSKPSPAWLNSKALTISMTV